MKLDRERQTLYDIIYMWNLNNNTNESIYKIKTYRKQIYGYQSGKERRDKLGAWD